MRTRVGAQEGHRHLDVVAADKVLIPLLRGLLLALWCRVGPPMLEALTRASLSLQISFNFLPTRLSLSTLCTDCRTCSFSLLRQHGPSRAVASSSAGTAGHQWARTCRQTCDVALYPNRAKTHCACFNFAFLAPARGASAARTRRGAGAYFETVSARRASATRSCKIAFSSRVACSSSAVDCSVLPGAAAGSRRCS